MNEAIRQAAAEFSGWKMYPLSYDHPNETLYWCEMSVDNNGDDIVDGYVCRVDEYEPDTNIQQAADLKARLRELGIEYQLLYVPDSPYQFRAFIWVGPTWSHTSYGARSKLSEEEALTKAVAQLQKGKE